MKIRFYSKALWETENIVNAVRTKFKNDKTKVFGIGRNKTGTTSLKKAMQKLGYVVGNQHSAELMFDDWVKRDFNKIIRYCHTAQFFQDLPFSLPDTFAVIDKSFPGSKFILTVRDSPEQWYNSITSFHAKLWGKNGRIPTKEDLQNATYLFKGWPWHTNRAINNTPPDDPYNRDLLIKNYINHNQKVMEYFKDRPNDLLLLNVAEKGAFKRLAIFVGKEVKIEEFPWENRTL